MTPITITPELIIGIATALGLIGTSYITWRKAAKADHREEIDKIRQDQREQIEQLKRDIQELRDLYRAETMKTTLLIGYIGRLQGLMEKAGISVPPMPDFDSMVKS